MEIFLITLLITFFTLIGVALLINLCKKKPRNGRHQLTGMCHKSGGTVCSGCSDLANIKK